MTEQLALELWLERPRRPPTGCAPCVSPRWGRVHLWRGGRWRKVHTIRVAARGWL